MPLRALLLLFVAATARRDTLGGQRREGGQELDRSAERLTTKLVAIRASDRPSDHETMVAQGLEVVADERGRKACGFLQLLDRARSLGKQEHDLEAVFVRQRFELRRQQLRSVSRGQPRRRIQQANVDCVEHGTTIAVNNTICR
jgi:hypothetical protein